MEKQYVGIDLHRRRSLVVRRDDTGTTHSMVRLDNSDLAGIVAEVRAAGPEPDVIVEATNGWYWLIDLLRAEGAHVHLAHPLGNNWGTRRVKNDERDATDLVDLYRLGRLVESYVAPPELREQRELVRYRHKLIGFRTSCREQVHAVLAKEGVAVPMTDLFGVAGLELLDHVPLGGGFAIRVESLRDLIELIDREVAMLDREIHHRLRNDPHFGVLQLLPGIGPVFAAILVTEIGDISRFSSPERLCSWAGLTPRHRSPTRRCTGARSPSREAASCAGRSSRPCSARATAGCSARRWPASPSAAGAGSRTSPRHGAFSPLSSTR